MQVRISLLRITTRARCRFARDSAVKNMILFQVLSLRPKAMRKWKCILKKWKKWSWITCLSEQGLVEYQRSSNYRQVRLKIRSQWSQVIKSTCSCIRIAIVGRPLNKSRSLTAHFKSVTHLAHRMDQFSKLLMSMSRKCPAKWPNQAQMAQPIKVKNSRNRSCQRWFRASESSMRMSWGPISLTFILNMHRTAVILSIILAIISHKMATNLSAKTTLKAITKLQALTKMQKKMEFNWSLMIMIWHTLTRRAKRNTHLKLRSLRSLIHF